MTAGSVDVATVEVVDDSGAPVRGLLLRAIEAYQRAFEGRPSPCRFYPSCSAYGHEAIEVHGAGKGLWLTARRLVRCRPFGPSGFDPVPLPHDPAGGHACEPATDSRHVNPLSSPIEEC